MGIALDVLTYQDVLLTIRGSQSDTSGDDERVIELMVEGRIYRDEPHVYLTYEESDLSGVEGVQTMLDVEGERVTLYRTGEIRTSMVFEEGRRYQSVYETPLGRMQMGIFPNSVYSSVDGEEGEVALHYQLDFGGRFIGNNTLSVTYRPCGSKDMVKTEYMQVQQQTGMIS